MQEKSNILVVGGAGYVGSTTATWLLDQGHRVTVLDDLSTGFRMLIDPRAKFTQARAGDRKPVGELLKSERFDAVFHFAAKALAGESVEKPREYFENNVEQTRALLEAMHEAGVRRFVFSSTCAVFGTPETERISETSVKKPINPYGETKLQAERLLAERARLGLQSVALRYFNAAGAEPGLRVGELHEPETHLIPLVLQAASKGEAVSILGTDYPTSDGTCVRDYIHVWDLAAAHGAAMARLLASKESAGIFESFNLGSEKGFSVREVIRECEKSVGRKIPVKELPRRPGDPPSLVADSSLAKKELGFHPEFSSIDQVVDTAWRWHQQRRN